MAKTKKPAPKGGKKIAAPKKVAKRAPAKKKLTARQIDQINADKMRTDSAIAAGKAAVDKALAQLAASAMASRNFGASMSKPLHPTVEEQYLAAKDAYAHTLGDAESLALHRAEQARNQKPAKRGWFARFRSAITGLFVSKKYAEANPDTTVREKAD